MVDTLFIKMMPAWVDPKGGIWTPPKASLFSHCSKISATILSGAMEEGKGWVLGKGGSQVARIINSFGV